MVYWQTSGINADQMKVVNGRLCKATGTTQNGRNIPLETDNTDKADLAKVRDFWVSWVSPKIGALGQNN
jgi:hypothetical protein